jgi:molybdopterin molybdotransferase
VRRDDVSSAEPLLDAVRARALLADAWPALGSETVTLAEAVGRILADDQISPEDLPAFARSAMDGFALQAGATAEASEAAAVRLILGQRAWPIATGGAVPPDGDAVVMVEQTSTCAGPNGAEVVLKAPVAVGRNIIPKGDDVQVGGLLAAAKKRLTPRDLALLAAVGITSVPVMRRPRVAVLSSGSELVAPGTRVPPGKVRDVNQLALHTSVRAAGGDVHSPGILPDDAGAIAAGLADLSRDHDLILITGGTSVGVADHTAAALRAAGAQFLFHGLAIRPGRPTLAAVLGRCLVVGLPGVPVAATIAYEIFVRPLLDDEDRAVVARLAVELSSAAGREDHVRVTLERRPDGLWAHPVPGPASSLRALATAAGVAIVPAAVSSLPAGAGITVIRF